MNSNIFLHFLKHAVISLPCHVPCGIYLSWYIYLLRYVSIAILQCVKLLNLSVPWRMVDPMPGTWTHKCKTNDFAPCVKFSIFHTFKAIRPVLQIEQKKYLAVVSHFFPSRTIKFLPNFQFSFSFFPTFISPSACSAYCVCV